MPACFCVPDAGAKCSFARAATGASAIAEHVAAAPLGVNRCPRCGCALHSATYPRKPHGLAAALRDDVRRFSLCCSVCRRRVKPPSVRFFGRRFRVAPLFLVVSALAVAGGVRLHTVARRWGVAPATLKRWRRWWLEAFPETREWRAKRGELAAPPEEPALRRLLRIMRGRSFRSRRCPPWGTDTPTAGSGA